MLTIKCAKCKKKLFKYYKVGSGKVLKCFYSRMEKDQTLRKEGSVFCKCGNLIGIQGEDHIKMRSAAFIYRGTKN